ncbi:M28 family peptidase [Azospirillum sp.]|uniref:M28 family peptidase n=1 Tax=Azospirillum sp. TaxID=34012 RepID=UPI00260AD0C4|nr:M28 family peptidase [Azospirillum sp.]
MQKHVMGSAGESAVEAADGPPLAAVSGERMMDLLGRMARWTKVGGTETERECFRFLKDHLDALGVPASVILHDAYISVPLSAHLTCEGERFDAITHSMARSSGPDGRTGDLLDLGNGSAADFAQADVGGRVVLVDGVADPDVALRASRAGAVGVVHVSPHALCHEMCVSPVWGSPSATTVGDLPTVVVVTVADGVGAALRRRLADGRAAVTLHAMVDSGWRKTPLLVADLPPTAGASSPDRSFVLVSCHVDTWFEGVMDNGTANVAMIEVVRVLADLRDQWRRGLRLCLWSGHSQGRYSGSAWYADHHWLELEARCVAHVNLDSPGAVGALNLTKTGSAGALFDLAADAIREETGQTLAGRRKARSADDSFPGLGIPSVFGSLSMQEAGALKLRNELGWWWHTEHDRIDKIDPAHLARDARVVLRVVWGLLRRDLLPLDYRRQVADLAQELASLSDRLSTRFDLQDAENMLRLLRQRLDQLHAATEYGIDVDAVNRAIVAICRALVPLDYTTGNRFAHDPALPLPTWPVLEPIRKVAASKPGTDEEQFAKVDAIRSRNRLVYSLRQAVLAVDAVLDRSGI